MKTVRLAIIVLLMSMAAAMTASGYEEYSGLTGHDCAYCHEDPAGGGMLTVKGEGFAAEAGVSTATRRLGPARRVVRLIVGYLHMLAGVIWFGTIFYVHIILKPAYASKGLPKSELILGWSCIIIVGVTGVLLSISRIGSIDALFETRFGILLLIKAACYSVMAGTAGLVTFVIGPRLRRRAQLPGPGATDVFGPDSLAAFDGGEGRGAYVAVDGEVYDLSPSRLWKGGKHTRHLAGMDLSGAIRQAPHGLDKLDGFTKVGRYQADAGGCARNMPKSVFYFMAYMNLGFVFIVLGIIALWRWW